MEKHTPHSMSTFVIRCWREYEGQSTLWRGRIEHVQSGKQRAFESLDQMVRFVQGYIDMESEESCKRV